MRFFLILAVFVSFLPNECFAQTYYNAPTSSSGSPQPLNIKGMLQGNDTRGRANTGYTYQGKPYGVDRSSYSLALTPDQVRRNNADRVRIYAQREKEKNAQRAKLEARNKQSLEGQTQAYLNQLNSNTELDASAKKARKKRVLYNQDRIGLDVPKRVFNSPY